MMRILYKIR